MILSSGFIIAAGLVLLAIKLPVRTTLRVLAYPFALDIGITVLVLAVHWGTFSGVMAASFAGLICSVLTSGARLAIGYIQSGKYYRGRLFDLTSHLKTPRDK
jgi:hypothetical protein